MAWIAMVYRSCLFDWRRVLVYRVCIARKLLFLRQSPDSRAGMIRRKYLVPGYNQYDVRLPRESRL
jgi:hypothetical protein